MQVGAWRGQGRQNVHISAVHMWLCPSSLNTHPTLAALSWTRSTTVLSPPPKLMLLQHEDQVVVSHAIANIQSTPRHVVCMVVEGVAGPHHVPAQAHHRHAQPRCLPHIMPCQPCPTNTHTLSSSHTALGRPKHTLAGTHAPLEKPVLAPDLASASASPYHTMQPHLLLATHPLHVATPAAHHPPTHLHVATFLKGSN